MRIKNNFPLGVLVATCALGVSMKTLGFLGIGDSAGWSEEILLHDGNKILAERKQKYGGKPTADSRELAVLEEEWKFQIAGGSEAIAWKSDFSQPPKGSRLTLVVFGIKARVPYIATSPSGCVAYNYWGRPNPPYVFFRRDGNDWKRIALAEFPIEFGTANVVVGGRGSPEKLSGMVISKESVQEQNRLLPPYLRTLIREPINVPQTIECEELIYYKGAWIMPNDSIAKSVLDRKQQTTGK